VSGNVLNTILPILLILVVPFVLYVVVRKHQGTKKAVLVSMIATVMGCGLMYFLMDGLGDKIIAAALGIVVLGTISYRSDNPYFFRLEPAIKGFATAGYFVYFRVVSSPVIEDVMSHMSSHDLFTDAPEIGEVFRLVLGILEDDPVIMSVIEISLIVASLIYGAGMVYVAKHWSDVSWLVAKFLQTPFYIICMVLSLFIWGNIT